MRVAQKGRVCSLWLRDVDWSYLRAIALARDVESGDPCAPRTSISAIVREWVDQHKAADESK